MNKTLVKTIAAKKGLDESRIILTPDYIVVLEESSMRCNAGMLRKGYNAYIKATLFESADDFESENEYDSCLIPVFDYIERMEKEELLYIVTERIYGADTEESEYAA